MLPGEAGEDGGNTRHELGERGSALRLWMPALDHDRVAGGEERRSREERRGVRKEVHEANV